MSNHTEAVDDIKKAKDALDSISTTTKHPDAKKHNMLVL